MCAEMAQVASATSEIELSEPASMSIPTDRGCPSSSVGPASLSVRCWTSRSERQKTRLAMRVPPEMRPHHPSLCAGFFAAIGPQKGLHRHPGDCQVLCPSDQRRGPHDGHLSDRAQENLPQARHQPLAAAQGASELWVTVLARHRITHGLQRCPPIPTLPASFEA